MEGEQGERDGALDDYWDRDVPSGGLGGSWLVLADDDVFGGLAVMLLDLKMMAVVGGIEYGSGDREIDKPCPPRPLGLN